MDHQKSCLGHGSPKVPDVPKKALGLIYSKATQNKLIPLLRRDPGVSHTLEFFRYSLLMWHDFFFPVITMDVLRFPDLSEIT